MSLAEAETVVLPETVAPLDGENRVLVKHGLEALNRTERPGLRALIEVAGQRGEIRAERTPDAHLNVLGVFALAALHAVLVKRPGRAMAVINWK